MKRCPSCQRTYPDDAPDYCPNDGQRLVREEAAAFDPEKTVTASGVRLEDAAPKEPQTSAESQPQPSAPPPSVQTQTPTPVEQQPVQPPPAPGWGSQYQPPPQAPFGLPNAQRRVGASKAFAIGSLVLGVDAATFMLVMIIRNLSFTYILMIVLSSLSILLAVAALVLALKSPASFGGVGLAIVGLALGVAGLVYFLLNQS